MTTNIETNFQDVSTAIPVLEMQGITKRFHGVPALQNVNLTIYPGEVHALMGENGAGKSTLMKILAGAYIADEGEIRINGQPVKITDPGTARKAGINLIYQELNVAPNLTVTENMFMGSELRRGQFLDRKAMEAEARQVLESLGASFGANDIVGTLAIAEQQQVEIARALKDKSRILVMDEPTAALSDRETERLFEVIRKLRNDGIAIIYISHRMEEIYALADRISVLRDGQYIGSLTREEISPQRLVQMMVGRSMQDFYEHQRQTLTGGVVLEVRNISDGRKVKPATFQLYAGEILGLAGLVGAGRTELCRLIFGADSKISGEVFLHGKKLEINSPSDAIAAGIGYVPEDRKNQGLFLEMSSRKNIGINRLKQDARAGLVNWGAVNKIAAQAVENFNIRLANLEIAAVNLSGGNQQKLLLARWLAIKPRVLMLDEPTRGVDIGAKSEIYRIISELATQGVAILMVSSELPEIVGMSDRVLVMREGELVGELDDSPEKRITQENIMHYATGSAEVLAS
ncbi:sugar ABC transporter ATP-binding protein [Aetokthonos hydrillicola Thurmond2011]|jgi:ribose transport system ATP-binding protein|uniref:Sugar ABC transporter ATP-binding protein n=2 Tax=Aetokthonos TaxID=1550243 RepID=A0AAP5IFB6_9CYAN|nr:sugar ABC transporter ATP-binding protein [Aetokthonos hydrillicola]MBO3463487.1 sugar ABC transporter ATP-binding protein [Aetokthonos hydrillicola CCALA 1050]MBW4591175.1 sugar ABC transporter ATP-binding protein [Aetokthonos hydrillicola CCALA 1050]MDR9899857.1 sugar ABC transporter ATP-binding protein [Aetokthonos hydrillicola Thurmond2011]